MQLPCIRINQSDPPPKFDFLKQLNFLGEFKTEVDKARVRFNLGIPDSYSFNWGNIGGTIDNQRDLKTKFDLYYNLLGIERNRIDDILEQIDVLNSITTRLSNVIEGSDSISQMSTDIEDFKQRLTRAETNINQNTALILQLINGGVTPNPTPIYGYATEDWVRSWVLSLGYLTSSDLNGYITISTFNELVNRVTALEGKTLTEITVSPSSLSATEGDYQPKPITVTAVYSDNSTTDITQLITNVSSNNDAIVTWNNHMVQINGAGLATLTFSYGGKTATLSVVVNASGVIPVTPSYIGWATTYEQIIGNSIFETSTLAKEWNDSNLKMYGNIYPTYLWACTPSGTVITNVIQGPVTETWNSPTLVFENYNVYYLGKAEIDRSGVTLTITTANG